MRSPVPASRLRAAARPPRSSSAKTATRHTSGGPLVASDHPHLVYGRRVLELEARAIESLAPRLGAGFVRTIDLVLECPGHVVVTGIGKPGFLAQKLSATLASTGTPSLYLHPAEAVHGDLGRVTEADVILALSNSGNTEDLLRLLPPLKRIGAKLVAITGDPTSPLARGAVAVIDIGRMDEACPLGLVPTTSSAAMHAVCDAIALTVLQSKPISSDEYALFHPGGALGRRVMRVAELMRSGVANPVVRETEPLFRAVAVMTNTPGRPGATSVVDRRGRLAGIFTDGDLRRLVERGHQDFSVAVRSVMGHKPRTCLPEALVQDAAALMHEARIDQLPVVDGQGRPVGLLDVQDLLAARFV
ncbi:MAG: KpsF/GutQ family sugar-phosphate isomerase [Deltaproteobacteria bacterium]|nr:KpsF/GutQ family sugar-phosphate isomerase [Deltaproteobacteria bacterium]